MNRQGIEGMKYLFSHRHNQFTQREWLKSERERGKRVREKEVKKVIEKEVKKVREKDVKKVREKEIKW